MSKEILLISQIVSGLVLIVLISLQVKGKGFGRVWGSANFSFTRRGLENQVFRFTFVISFIFLLVSTLELLV
ncbi:MAG: hypothetical protein ACD_24C00163G0002 [uncultured bacterium]|uniref:Uncharacterized protein n=1 Tax=Candidatus Woesebacteria bacterium RIFCSPLOWO2_01_FULL_39_21 TaxID=1802519 RepID=A0A1F8BGM2_9BACT|nr:MAG: hypothetical protein ACD_24C00163G0002 [uncultured bacterium]OGM23009.1 MAG: hypothetical protein A2691_03690 [Candidatus Woesebacteria bacterium RIFCSPHIGHO2_01_FULL_39_23]OGM63153.1 MAG: hypothetical protein A2961_01275 [Candidatus Woesebacteria bacterium RIFCSPLOWO2_01_FULL_39_21]